MNKNQGNSNSIPPTFPRTIIYQFATYSILYCSISVINRPWVIQFYSILAALLQNTSLNGIVIMYNRLTKSLHVFLLLAASGKLSDTLFLFHSMTAIQAKQCMIKFVSIFQFFTLLTHINYVNQCIILKFDCLWIRVRVVIILEFTKYRPIFFPQRLRRSTLIFAKQNFACESQIIIA